MESKKISYGAVIERGVITGKTETVYNVKSIDRPGIEIWDIGTVDPLDDFETGDTVLFFAFGDGTGKILCGA